MSTQMKIRVTAMIGNPCKRKFENIAGEEWDKDYEILLNSVQRHTLYSSAYCFRRKNNEEISCRYKCPKEC